MNKYTTSTLIFLLAVAIGGVAASKQTSKTGLKIPKGYSKIVFQDEFNGQGLPDSLKWDYEVGYVRNREMQYYTPNSLDHSYISKGCLHLVARPDSIRRDGRQCKVTSASIHTKRTFNYKYGRVEVRAKLPVSLGTWPAIWMMPAKSTYGAWPKSGEIDIMEHVGYEPEKVHYAAHTFHSKTTKQGIGSNIFTPDVTEFHVYAFEWHEDRLEWYFDGRKRYVYTIPDQATWEQWPFDQPYYLILNLAFGGGWGGIKGVDLDLLPQQYVIDYIRVFQ